MFDMALFKFETKYQSSNSWLSKKDIEYLNSDENSFAYILK